LGSIIGKDDVNQTLLKKKTEEAVEWLSSGRVLA
jgi:hypothetical protein